MPLHRFVTPTYFGGLPVTHDLINVVSGGVGAGDGSSVVSPPKAGPHPNEGTYFVAFGEDATSGNANRGFKALAENTDFLDDIVHADQSVPTVSAAVVPGAPVTSVVISANVFVGGAVEVNDQRTRSGLVAVLDGDGYPLHILSGAVYVSVVVSKIHDGSDISVLSTGYYVNPTVDFNPAIPAGQSYRLVYYTRSNLKTQPTRTYTRLAQGIRGEEDLWAFAKTTRLGNTTFTGEKTFQDVATFQNTVTFDGIVTIQDLLQFVGSSARMQASADDLRQVGSPLLTILTDTVSFPEIPVTHIVTWNNSDGGHIRDYYLTIPGSGGATTDNAAWDAVTQTWIPDYQNLSATLTLVGPVLYVTTLIPQEGTGLLPASWDSTTWTSTGWPGGSTTISGALTTRTIFDTSDPHYYLTYSGPGAQYTALEVNDLHLNAGDENWVPLALYYTTDGITQRYPRLLGAGNNSFAGLRLSWNAWWDAATSRWTADASGVSNRQAYAADINANGLTARVKADTSSTWLDSAWSSLLQITDTVFKITPIPVTYTTNYAVSKMLSLAAGRPEYNQVDNNLGWIFQSGTHLVSTGTGEPIYFPIYISGTDVEISVIVKPVVARATSTDRMLARLMRVNSAVAIPGSNGSTTLASVRDNGTLSVQPILLSVASLGLTTERWLYLEITSGTTVGSGDILYSIQVRYNQTSLSPNSVPP